jgi:hypothetical protein
MKKRVTEEEQIVYTDEIAVSEKIIFLENEARKVNEFAGTFERYFNEKLSIENFKQLSNEKQVRTKYYDIIEKDIKQLNIKAFTIVETMKMNMVKDMNHFFEEVQTIRETLKYASSFNFENGICSVSDDAKVDIYTKNSIVLSSEASKKAYQVQLEVIDAVNRYLQTNEKYFKSGIIANPDHLLSSEIAKYDKETNRYEYTPLNFERALRIINYKE